MSKWFQTSAGKRRGVTTTHIMVVTSALNVKVLEKLSLMNLTGETMTLIMVATYTLNVRVVENIARVNDRRNHDPHNGRPRLLCLLNFLENKRG